MEKSSGRLDVVTGWKCIPAEATAGTIRLPIWELPFHSASRATGRGKRQRVRKANPSRQDIAFNGRLVRNARRGATINGGGRHANETSRRRRTWAERRSEGQVFQRRRTIHLLAGESASRSYFDLVLQPIYTRKSQKILEGRAAKNPADVFGWGGGC